MRAVIGDMVAAFKTSGVRTGEFGRVLVSGRGLTRTEAGKEGTVAKGGVDGKEAIKFLDGGSAKGTGAGGVV